MSAYLICHWERQKGVVESEARAQLARRISELWDGTLQLDGIWIVHSENTSDQMRDELLPYLPATDALIVVGAGQDAAWAGFAANEAEWLLQNI
jgi:hypothetical protein